MTPFIRREVTLVTLCAAMSAAVALGAFAPPAVADSCDVQSDATYAWYDACVAEPQPVWSGEADPFAAADPLAAADWLAADPTAGPPADAAAAAPLAEDPTADPSVTSLPALDTTLSAVLSPLSALLLTVSGQTLSWPAVSGVSSYVFVRKVTGQADQYSIVGSMSVTPPAVPGATVSYSVRTNVAGSAWAPEVSIAYPAPPPVPAMSVSGQTVLWTAVAGVSSYVFARKVPGQATQYSLVGGTSVTPAPVPGQTVQYGVRTNVAGSAWAPEVSIAYPDSSPPPPAGGSADGFSVGVVAGSALSYELSFLKSLGAHTARIEFGIGTSAASMASTIDAYAKAGIRPLLLASFYGRTPTTAEAQNLGSWASAYGPGGTFWAGKSYPANTAVTDIELGNETSYAYQFSDNSPATYAARAQTYALRARDAQTAIDAANPNVGLLAQGDNAIDGTAWVANMLKAVPDLGSRVAGWTIHPYGPSWATRIASTIASAAAGGAPSSVPIWVTEWGLSTDDGSCLDDNYGWSTCMTYAAAAATLHTVLGAMRATYGSRLGGFYLYQAHDQAASGTQSGREAYFGALQSSGASKGAYTTEVRADVAANP